MTVATATIQLLPTSVASRIAAGEVIDRPAAVVKELVENAIDAGATEIHVEARGGGLRLIRVADDGSGIPAVDIELAFRRHATSKLREIDDLEQIGTFGFRGEALAAIAAIAEVNATSAIEDNAGVSCTFHAGRLLERTTASRPRGTTIIVRDLFSQMPARLKFMRGARAEAIQIGAVMRRFALVRPDLKLTLLLEGHHAFFSPAGSLETALNAVYGEEVTAALIALAPVKAAGASISGVLSGPTVVRATRGQLAVFVNGRYVRSRPLLSAIEAGYRAVLPRGRHPVGAIYLAMPPTDLDVNVHPAKLDVRLRREAEVAQALSEAVSTAYGRQPRAIQSAVGLALDGEQQRMPGLSRRIGEARVPGDGWGDGVHLPAGQTLPSLRLLGQAANALLVAEGDAGLYLVDQHRAHERVIYERLRTDGRPEQQSLIQPELLTLHGSAIPRLTERLQSLEALGFSCEPFGPDSFIVRATPAGEGLELRSDAIEELLAEAAAEQEDWQERFLATLSCRSAIRKGHALGVDQACDLLTKLGSAHSPAVCPHGSPVLLQIGEFFLARQFNWG
jgi:DNA mismatch repair protein MutL